MISAIWDHKSQARIREVGCNTGSHLHVQSWPKMLGWFPKLDNSLPHIMLSCCYNCMFMYSPNDFSGYQHCLGVPKIRNDSTTKLMATCYRYPEHKCTLQVLFSYLSKKILARGQFNKTFTLVAKEMHPCNYICMQKMVLTNIFRSL